MKKYRIYILVIFCFVVNVAWSQSIFTNPITGTNPNTVNPYTTGQTSDANIVVTGIGRGSGIAGANANDRYNASGWNSGSFDANDYFEFTLTPGSGYKIDFVSFVYTGQASGTGPTSFSFRSSVDSYGSGIGTPSATGTTIDLSAAAYQGLTTAITFRIYGWGASAAGGTFSINSFTFNGTVSASCTAPSIQATGFGSNTITTTSANISFTRGNGDGGVIVVARAGSSPSADPVSGTLYTANADITNGSSSTIGGGKVVYIGTANGISTPSGNIPVSGLSPSTTYHFNVYEYNAASTCFKSPALTGSFVTDAGPCVTPVDVIGGAAVSGTNGQSQISWTNSTCFDEIMIVAKASSSISGTPTGDGTAYTANLAFGNGTAFDGGFVAYKGSGSPQTISSLSNGTEYFFKIFVRKGSNWSTGVEVAATPNNGTVYYSRGNGLITNNIWSLTRSGTASAATFSNATDMVVQNGNTVSFTGITATLKNLNVETGGKLFRNATTAGSFINIYGNIICDGIIGNGSLYDHVGFDIEGATCSITGSGTFDCGRISKNTSSTSTVYFKREVNLRFGGSCLYVFFNGNTLLNYVIDEGVTVNVIGNGGTNGDIALDGADGVGGSQAGGSYLINGILSVTGTAYFTTNNTNASYPCSLTVGGTGKLYANTLNCSNSGSAGHSLQVLSGGLISTSNNIASFGNTNNLYSLQSGSTFEYGGSGSQNIESALSYANLSLSNSSSKTPNGDLNIAGNLSISGTATLAAGTRTLTIGGNWLQGNISSFTSSAATIIFNGNASQTIDSQGESFEKAIFSGNGAKSLLSNLNISQIISITGGILDATTHTLNGGADLVMTGGLLKMAKTSVTLPEISGNYSITGGSIELYGNGIQTLRGARDYKTLVFSNQTNSFLSSAPNTVSGVVITGNAILNTQSNNLGGDFTTLSMTGASKLITSRSGTVPTMADLYFLDPGTTIEFTGSNASTSIRQGPTTGGTTPHKYQNIILSGTATITGPANILNIEGNFTNSLTGKYLANGGTVSFSGISQVIGGTAVTDFYNINLGASSSVALASAQRIAGTLSLGSNSTYNTNGQNFTLTSTANGTARIGPITNGTSLLGNIIIQRYIPTAKRVYRFMASPIQNATFSQWQAGTHITGPGGASNGFDPSGTNAASCFSYVETVTGADYRGFTTIPLTSATIEPGTGYRILIRGDRSINLFSPAATQTATGTLLSLSGQPNTGDKPLFVTYTPDVVSAAGWNLVGNPYPSEINWNSAGWTKTNIGGSIYVMDPRKGNSSTGGYYTYNGLVSDDGRDDGNIIPSMQGFFVRATGANPVLQASESVKATTPTSFTGNNFRREPISNLLRFKFSNDLNGGNEDFAVIHFREDATVGFDEGADGYKFGGSSVSLASQPQPGLVMAINSMPANIDSAYIPLHLFSNYRGTHSLSAITVQNFDPSFSLYLFDRFKHDTLIAISPGFTYAFELSSDSGSLSKNRFAVIAKKATLIPTDPPVDTTVIEPVTIPDDIIVQNPATSPDTDLTITKTKNKIHSLVLRLFPNPNNGHELYAKFSLVKSAKVTMECTDLSGRMIFERIFSLPQGETILELINERNLSEGVYLIKVITENGTVTNKIYITR